MNNTEQINEIIKDVTEEEKDNWSGEKRARGRPTQAATISSTRRDLKIIEIAKVITASFPQSIRHIYYVVSALRLVGKDHGQDSYWYNQVKDIIGRARWGKELPWDRIADDTRPFNRPSSYENGSHFLESMIPIFKTNKWRGQKERVLVCTEKDAMMAVLSDSCYRYHVPLMSFHGQASDGGAIYELAEYISKLKGQHDTVHIYYLGDFDPAGRVIDRVVFGDPMSSDQDEDIGKLRRLYWQITDYADGFPAISYERLGIVEDDLMNPDYALYLLEANKDTNYPRYLAEISEVPIFPLMQVANGNGAIEQRPATLGIDALDSAEVISRVETAIKRHIQDDVWEKEEKRFIKEKKSLHSAIKKLNLKR